MSKAVARARRDKLTEVARRLGYPWSLLTLSMYSYPGPRTLIVENICAAALWPSCGLGLGSVWAVVELVAYIAEDMRAVVHKCAPAL